MATRQTEAEAQLARAPPTITLTISTEEVLHELQLHQIELEMQNEELRNAQANITERKKAEEMSRFYRDCYV